MTISDSLVLWLKGKFVKANHIIWIGTNRASFLHPCKWLSPLVALEKVILWPSFWQSEWYERAHTEMVNFEVVPFYEESELMPHYKNCFKIVRTILTSIIKCVQCYKAKTCLSFVNTLNRSYFMNNPHSLLLFLLLMVHLTVHPHTIAVQ